MRCEWCGAKYATPTTLWLADGTTIVKRICTGCRNEVVIDPSGTVEHATVQADDNAGDGEDWRANVATVKGGARDRGMRL
jgi:hypothetical protein